MSRAVLLSFTETLDCIAEGTLSDEELGEAIFAFGCDPKWPYFPSEESIARHAPYQRAHITPEIIAKVQEHLRAAEQDGRAVWRRMAITPYGFHAALSAALERCGLNPLNENLPSLDGNEFLAIAIQRVNNKNGLNRVRIISS